MAGPGTQPVETPKGFGARLGDLLLRAYGSQNLAPSLGAKALDYEAWADRVAFGSPVGLPSVSPGARDIQELHWRARQLARAFHTFDDPDIHAWIRVRVYADTYEQAAEASGVPSSTIHDRLEAADDALRALLYRRES